ncbi:hypothetical protein SAY87_025966 [Trapa incisa]|uniref:Clp R domain-containing protein n=1 Tax=Trapa incisa TaxID=236973 RepID=A0AAN7GRC4_9MYRT|nr:hypothetical protein SAY87_025966 [Trapa incisa]
MPTPVSIARQCLTAEAANALDEAVAVARRRGHGQTTSLHVVSALLSLPSSVLREACARARGSGPPYPTRLQLKALELCLSVSLDRVPSGQPTEDPPVSNSLMAAIKRSQASQKRQPENFHLYHQLMGQSSINNVIKVELKQLIISILDDPVVSRVFGEAGFRSSEIKLAFLRPFPHLFRYGARQRVPPLFFCSADPDRGGGLDRIKFPFSVMPGFLHGGADANCHRIGEVLLGRSGGSTSNNPLLIGACSHGALREFVQVLGKSNGDDKHDAVLPQELSRFTVIDIESSISEGTVHERLDEVASTVASKLSGEVLVVSIGDLKAFLHAESASSEINSVSRTVERLTTLLVAHRESLRLMGFAASNDAYSDFVGKFPAVEKEWKFQLLPITTLRPSRAESSPRSSLMESFVPFAGFFSSSADYNGEVSTASPFQYLAKYNLCSGKKSEREAIPIPKSALTTSIADQYQCSLPPWLQLTELCSNAEVKDDMVPTSTTVMDLQNEQGDKPQPANQNPPVPVWNTYGMDFQAKTATGFLTAEERSKMIDDRRVNGERCKSVNLSMSGDMQKDSPPGFSAGLLQMASSLKPSAKESFLTKLLEKSSKSEDRDSGFLRSGSNLSTEDIASPVSTASTNTNVGQRARTVLEIQKLDCTIETRRSHPHICGLDFKAIYKALSEKVRRQQEAVSLISETMARSKARKLEAPCSMGTRGDVWFTLLGPDRMAKWKVAVSLCEVLYGNREHLIHVDLNPQSDHLYHRGKTPVDLIAGELSKKPLCVVFLENVDCADEQVQSSLLQAILTGKFSDSRGREIGIHQAIFLATLTSVKPDQDLHSDEPFRTTGRFSEERVLRAKEWPMQIQVCQANDEPSGSSSMNMNKRKLAGSDVHKASRENLEVHKKHLHRKSSRHLDLNLPAENAEPRDYDECGMECDAIFDNSKAWLLDFMDRTDANVMFKPYDFDTLAQKISKDIRDAFHQTIGLKCTIEIEAKVMEQLLSTIYGSDGDEEELTKSTAQLLSRDFAQIRQQCQLTDSSTVRLLACEDVPVEDIVPGNCLPCRVYVS